MVSLFNVAALLCWIAAIALGSGHAFVAGAVFAVGAGIIDELRKLRAAAQVTVDTPAPTAAAPKFNIPDIRPK